MKFKRMNPYVLCLILTVLWFNNAVAQNGFSTPRNVTAELQSQRKTLLEDRKAIVGFNVTMKIAFGSHNTSEIRFAFAGGVSKGIRLLKTEHTPFLFTYQLEVETFRGGVGTSLLGIERGKFQWEMRNVGLFTLGLESNNPVKGRPLLKTVGSSNFGIRDPYDYSFSLGTLFINGINHNRNQQIGIGSLGVLEVGFAYLNDGPPFNKIGLVDGYDRWWTGAGHLGVYFLNDNGFVTDIELEYQRYTGWQPNLYEVANTLELDYMSYLDTKQQFLNQGTWTWSVGVRNNLRINYTTFESKYTDVQDFLHIIKWYTFHPNVLDRRSTFGATYTLFGHQPLKF